MIRYVCFAVLVGVVIGAQVVKLEQPIAKKVNLVDRPAADNVSSWNPHEIWKMFKHEFVRSYVNIEEEAYRFGVFLENLAYIQGRNILFQKKKMSYALGINEYSDMSHAEFVRTFNGFRRSYNKSAPIHNGALFKKTTGLLGAPKLPDAVDWRKKGAVTPVKNQGQCGSCWSFSATGSLEGQHFVKTGKLVSLSEQNLVDCSKMPPYNNNGCGGGLMDNAFQYVKDNGGIDTERTYPYEAENDKCRYKAKNSGATDDGYQDLPQEDEDALKEALATVGPISVAIDASHKDFQHYTTGVYDNPACTEQLDHGVLAIGYGTDDEGNDYYIVKNSWGETWGNEGFIWMSRNKQNQCGIASQASYPIVGASGVAAAGSSEPKKRRPKHHRKNKTHGKHHGGKRQQNV